MVEPAAHHRAKAETEEDRAPLYIRAYWAEKAVLDGTWTPPNVEKVT
jgi:hypothetical protein